MRPCLHHQTSGSQLAERCSDGTCKQSSKADGIYKPVYRRPPACARASA